MNAPKLKAMALAVAAATTATTAYQAHAQLEEVIVTAQKRSESAQDVPIAITAFDEEAMKAQQITGFGDMRFAAPNVSYTKANFAGNNFMIRGVGTNVIAASSDAGVGIHVNEVPIISPRLFETEYYDVEQVAVLRGPQGTLYGRNTTAGAINYVTRKPHDEWGFKQRFTVGNYNHWASQTDLNIPVTDKFFLKFGYMRTHTDGWVENENNTLPDQVDPNQNDNQDKINCFHVFVFKYFYRQRYNSIRGFLKGLCDSILHAHSSYSD